MADSIIDHVSLSVSDLERSAAFYEKALAPLGIKRIMKGSSGIGFGKAMPNFWVRAGVGTFQTAEHLKAITPVHLCFKAASVAEVDAFHAAAIAAGGRDFGPAGQRREYPPGYYGAFVLDPDGHNIEAAIHHFKA